MGRWVGVDLNSRSCGGGVVAAEAVGVRAELKGQAAFVESLKVAIRSRWVGVWQFLRMR